jgi:hypothetical protein
VQRREFAAWIPPLSGQRGEFLHFARVNG